MPVSFSNRYTVMPLPSVSTGPREVLAVLMVTAVPVVPLDGAAADEPEWLAGAAAGEPECFADAGSGDAALLQAAAAIARVPSKIGRADTRVIARRGVSVRTDASDGSSFRWPDRMRPRRADPRLVGETNSHAGRFTIRRDRRRGRKCTENRREGTAESGGCRG